jgi:predicted transcriptional regulator
LFSASSSLRAVLAEVAALRVDVAYHESMESDPAEIRTHAGWKNVDDYRQDIEVAIAVALDIEQVINPLELQNTRWVSAPECKRSHLYSEEEWRPSAGGTHEHQIKT